MLVTQSDRDFFNEHKQDYPYIISICTPGDEIIPLHKKHLVSYFYDVDHEMVNKYRRYTPPKLRDAQKIVTKAFNWFIDEPDPYNNFKLLVHCDMGISRSSAAALGILWKISSQFFKRECYDNLMREYIEARKAWCAGVIDESNSVALKRYIEGRYNPGVKPNTKMLEYYRDSFVTDYYFPW